MSKAKIDKTLLQILNSHALPSAEYLVNLAHSATLTLQNEQNSYRPHTPEKTAGGLLDFAGKNAKCLPIIVVPDLHARSYFLVNIMNYHLPENFIKGNLTVSQALRQKKVYVVCVGDILHSESRCYKRWMQAMDEFMTGEIAGKAMTEEMIEGLATECMVMELKNAFPKNFHILKGNHENITNETGNGNYAFCKFVEEGEMVHLFMENEYGSEVTNAVYNFEHSLPLVAAFKDCVISHGEPLHNFTKKEIINGLKNDKTIKSFTWTKNGDAKDGSVLAMLKKLTRRSDFENARYFGGHRPVKENYATRQNGYYIQLHNPDRQNIALVSLDKVFDVEKDIVSVV